MISSTVVVACRGKRWFDLDSVRVPFQGVNAERQADGYQLTAANKHTRSDAIGGPQNDVGHQPYGHPAGAPPLDWHVDGHTATPEHDLNEEPMTLRYVVGDTRDVTATIEDGSVDLIFTSPPFLALRSYLPADHPDKHREIGSEPNPALFLDTLLELTAEWGRVLAPHGTLAVELGDTYSGKDGSLAVRTSDDATTFLPLNGPFRVERRLHPDVDGRHSNSDPDRRELRYNRNENGGAGWPLAKSLACIPQLYAVALAYGINPLTGQPSPAGRWRVRNWIAWHRPNPPVGALGDKWRPASSYITTACRGGKRWFDLDSVRTETDRSDLGGLRQGTPHGTDERRALNGEVANMTGSNPAGAPPLDWHTDGDLGTGHIILTTQPYAGSHYATFPMELPRKIIDCMCPRAVCRVCGVPRERMTDDTAYQATRQMDSIPVGKTEAVRQGGRFSSTPPPGLKNRSVETLGWSDCGHDNYRPGHVLDPFAGTGTTLAAAQDLGRDATGIDVDERSAWLARDRVGMFLEIEHAPMRAVVDTADL